MKKILSIILVLIVSLGLMVGCSNGGNGGGGGTKRILLTVLATKPVKKYWSALF